MPATYSWTITLPLGSEQLGIRIENFDQLVGSTKRSDDRFVNTRVTDFLPAVNITFKLILK
jgi:hypothetical protein